MSATNSTMSDKKSTLSSQLEDTIIQEAMLKENDKPMWLILMNILVVEYMNRLGDGQPPPVVKLALAVIFVGTEDRDLFPMTFNLLKCWELTSGPYWVVQEELVRFVGIRILEKIVAAEDVRPCQEEWAVLVQTLQLTQASPLRLRQRALLLSAEVTGIMALRENNQELFQVTVANYKSRYCFRRYLAWFHKWARALIADQTVKVASHTHFAAAQNTTKALAVPPFALSGHSPHWQRQIIQLTLDPPLNGGDPSHTDEMDVDEEYVVVEAVKPGKVSTESNTSCGSAGNSTTAGCVEDATESNARKGNFGVLASRIVCDYEGKSPSNKTNKKSWIMMIEDLQTQDTSASPGTKSDDTMQQDGEGAYTFEDSGAVCGTGGRNSSRNERSSQRDHGVGGFFQSFQAELWAAFSP